MKKSSNYILKKYQNNKNLSLLFLALLMFCFIYPLTLFSANVSPDYERVLMSRARFNARIGEYKEAEKFIKQAILLYEKSPNNYRNRLYLADIYSKTENYSNAIDIFNETRNNPMFFSYLCSKSDFYRAIVETKKTENYIKWYHKKIENNPQNINLESNFIDFLKFSGKIKEAIKEYKKLLSKNPNSFSYKIRYSDFLQSIGKIKEATSILEKLFNDYGYENYLIDKLVDLYFQQNRIADAKKILNNLLKNSNNIGDFRNIAQKYENHSLFNEAINTLESGGKKFGDSNIFLFEIGEVYEVELKSDMAAIYYRDSIIAHKNIFKAEKAIYNLIDDDDSNYDIVMKVLSKKVNDPELERKFLEMRMNYSIDFSHFKEAFKYVQSYAQNYDKNQLLRFYRIMEILGKEELSRKTLEILNNNYSDSFVGKMAKLELLKNGWLKNKDNELFLLNNLKDEMPLIIKSIAANLLSKLYISQNKVKSGIKFLVKSLSYSTITPDKILSGICKKCIEISRYNLARKYIEHLNFSNNIFFESLLNFYTKNRKKSIKKIEKYLITTPLIGDSDYNLSLMFLNYTSSPEKLSQYFKWRNDLFNTSNEVNLTKLNNKKGEILSNMIIDLINYKKNNFKDRKNIPDKDFLINRLMKSNGVNSSSKTFKYINDLKKKGFSDKYKSFLNKYVIQFPDSPFIFEAREELKEWEKNEKN